jgi:hypothetical protein
MKYPLSVLMVLCWLPALHAEELVKFDCHQTELRFVNDHWYLCCGRTGLKDLGPNERTAREVLNLVRDLRLSQRGSIGKPLPIVEYWLSDGRAPQSLTHNLNLMPFQPDHLHVEQLQGQWCVLDGSQVMFGFGAHVEDARRTVAVLKQYGFNRVGYVGMPVPVMMYFLATDEAPPQVRPTTATAEPSRPPPLALTLPGQQLGVANQSLDDAMRSGDRVYFEWFRAEVVCVDGHWKLMAGNQCLADFGPYQGAALDALRVVRFYRFTEQCRTGNSPSACTYYLVDGAAPRGLMLDLTSVGFDADALALRPDGAVWKLYERGRSLLVVGDSYEEANAALQMIQRHQFTHVCYLGHPDRPVLTILVRER